MQILTRSVLVSILLAWGTLAHAQLSPKPDGQWRALFGLAFTSVSGNSENSSLGLNADAVRQTDADKLTLYGQYLRAQAKVGGTTSKTSDLLRLGGKYDWDVTERVYAYGTGGFERDKIARIDSRWLVGGGAGYKLIEAPDTTFDVFGGLNVRTDRYSDPGVIIDNELRRTYTTLEMQLGEDSTHKISDSTSFRQRFVLYPNLDNFGEYRAVFDAGLVVSMTDRFKLTMSVVDRYDSLATDPIKKNDLIVFAGVSYQYGPK
ncbi:MAG: DUF481 domain-containing protein [Betaproteobacteria bacterium]|nr:DUF481 domain-containing protein [Betaproteobacteria bacterium]